MIVSQDINGPRTGDRAVTFDKDNVPPDKFGGAAGIAFDNPGNILIDDRLRITARAATAALLEWPATDEQHRQHAGDADKDLA